MSEMGVNVLLCARPPNVPQSILLGVANYIRRVKRLFRSISRILSGSYLEIYRFPQTTVLCFTMAHSMVLRKPQPLTKKIAK